MAQELLHSSVPTTEEQISEHEKNEEDEGEVDPLTGEISSFGPFMPGTMTKTQEHAMNELRIARAKEAFFSEIVGGGDPEKGEVGGKGEGTMGFSTTCAGGEIALGRGDTAR